MSRDRSNIGFGPSAITLTCPTSSAASALYSTWFRYGPFRSTNLAYVASYSLPASSSGGPSTSIGYVRIIGRMSSASTAGQTNFTLHSSTKGIVYGSTEAAGVFSWLAAYSSGLPTTGGSSSSPTTGAGTLTLMFAAVP